MLGLDAAQVREVLERSGAAGRVGLANFNSPTQIVISGELEGVQSAGQAMLAAGAKRVVPLNVSGAWHSALMEPARRTARRGSRGKHLCDSCEFDVISNVDGQPYRDVETIKRSLIRSVVDEVRWHDTAERLLTYALDAVVEFGASGVLSALLKRMPNAPPVQHRQRFRRRGAPAFADRRRRGGEGMIFADKTALITGASRGIGRAIAVEFAAARRRSSHWLDAT